MLTPRELRIEMYKKGIKQIQLANVFSISPSKLSMFFNGWRGGELPKTLIIRLEKFVRRHERRTQKGA